MSRREGGVVLFERGGFLISALQAKFQGYAAMPCVRKNYKYNTWYCEMDGLCSCGKSRHIHSHYFHRRRRFDKDYHHMAGNL